MKRIHKSRLTGLVALLLSGFLVGSVGGCSGGGNDAPPSDLEAGRKIKEESLKGYEKIRKPGKAKKAVSPEDKF